MGPTHSGTPSARCSELWAVAPRSLRRSKNFPPVSNPSFSAANSKGPPPALIARRTAPRSSDPPRASPLPACKPKSGRYRQDAETHTDRVDNRHVALRIAGRSFRPPNCFPSFLPGTLVPVSSPVTGGLILDRTIKNVAIQRRAGGTQGLPGTRRPRSTQRFL